MTEPKQTLDERWNQLLKEQYGKELTDSDAEELWVLLQNPAFVRAALTVMGGLELLKENLLRLNFGDPTQANLGSRVQGEVVATMNVFSRLISYSKEKDKPNE